MQSVDEVRAIAILHKRLSCALAHTLVLFPHTSTGDHFHGLNINQIPFAHKCQVLQFVLVCSCEVNQLASATDYPLQWPPISGWPPWRNTEAKSGAN